MRSFGKWLSLILAAGLWAQKPVLNTDTQGQLNDARVEFIQSGTGASTRTGEAKLQESISVKDFGAVGDGTTDDTTAIQAAVNKATTTALPMTVDFPQGKYRITAKINVGNNTRVVFRGHSIGIIVSSIERAAAFTTGDMVRVTGSGALGIANLMFDSINTSGAFAAVRVDTGGTLSAKGLHINNGTYGVVSDGAARLSLYDFAYINQDVTVASQAGLQLDCTTGSSTNILISGGNITAVTLGDPETLLSGINIACADGVQIDNLTISARRGITFSPSGTKYSLNTYIDNVILNAFTEWGVGFIGSPSNGFGFITISNSHLNGQHVVGGTASCIDVGYSGAANVDTLRFIGNNIMDCNRDGIRIGALSTAKSIEIIGNAILNNDAEAASYVGVRLATGLSGVHLRGNTIGNRSVIAALQDWGIAIEGTLTDSQITDNDLSSNAAGPLSITTSFAGLMTNNKGLDDVMSQTIASGTTIVLGGYPFYTIKGTAALQTINGGWAGRVVTLMFDNAAPGGLTTGGNIPRARTVVQNESVTLRFNGSSWYH